jgi:hypothetical protein
VKGQEGLVRSLCCLVLNRCQEQLECIGGTKRELLAETSWRQSEQRVLALQCGCTP